MVMTCGAYGRSNISLILLVFAVGSLKRGMGKVGGIAFAAVAAMLYIAQKCAKCGIGKSIRIDARKIES